MNGLYRPAVGIMNEKRNYEDEQAGDAHKMEEVIVFKRITMLLDAITSNYQGLKPPCALPVHQRSALAETGVYGFLVDWRFSSLETRRLAKLTLLFAISAMTHRKD